MAQWQIEREGARGVHPTGTHTAIFAGEIYYHQSLAIVCGIYFFMSLS